MAWSASFVEFPRVLPRLVGAALPVVAYQLLLFRRGVASATAISAAITSYEPAAIVRLSRIAPSCPWITNSPPPSLAMISRARSTASACVAVVALACCAPSFTTRQPFSPGTTCRSPITTALFTPARPTVLVTSVQVAVRRTLLSRIPLCDARINAAAQTDGGWDAGARDERWCSA